MLYANCMYGSCCMRFPQGGKLYKDSFTCKLTRQCWRAGCLLDTKVFFGFDNFFIAYAGQLIQPAEYMSMMFLTIFLVASSGSSLLAIASPSFRDEVHQVSKASKMQRFWIISSGTLIALAQASACISFRLDEVDSGPLQSIVIANVPIVGMFFYFGAMKPCQGFNYWDVR